MKSKRGKETNLAHGPAFFTKMCCLLIVLFLIALFALLLLLHRDLLDFFLDLADLFELLLGLGALLSLRVRLDSSPVVLPKVWAVIDEHLLVDGNVFNRDNQHHWPPVDLHWHVFRILSHCTGPGSR